MWQVDYHQGCCSFEVFVSGFMTAALEHKVPYLCINQLQARQHWRKGYTGKEALMIQRRQLLKEAEYLFNSV